MGRTCSNRFQAIKVEVTEAGEDTINIIFMLYIFSLKNISVLGLVCK